MNNIVKAGDRLILHARYLEADEDGKFHYVLLDGGTKATLMTQAEFKCARSEVVTLMPEKPKYDPCRLFRAGDKVTPKTVNGRDPGISSLIYRVCQDEVESGAEIKLVMDGCIGHITCNAAYLELVTPVEELEPYYIERSTSKNYWEVWKKDSKEGRLLIAMFHKNHPHSKETAESERDRLNAEYRKDMEK